ncbi:hypothetical protein [Chromobacterium violaceum]|uniref:hypothetical protein n=1 Tax=Chromobacterium violaceum TaxID=536 RepID=UPI00111C12F2|nr:hypothetical protein [Chromobacterium violaceum]
MFEVFIKLISAIVIATVSSWITVQLSRHKFRTEKWWEKKVSAYERVIDAFHSSKKFSSEHLDAVYKGHEVEEARDRELRKMAREARDEIIRASDVGAFILSAEAISILAKYEAESESLSRYESWQEYLDSDWSITHKYMKEFIAEAKRDLMQ